MLFRREKVHKRWRVALHDILPGSLNRHWSGIFCSIHMEHRLQPCAVLLQHIRFVHLQCRSTDLHRNSDVFMGNNAHLRHVPRCWYLLYFGRKDDLGQNC